MNTRTCQYKDTFTTKPLRLLYREGTLSITAYKPNSNSNRFSLIQSWIPIAQFVIIHDPIVLTNRFFQAFYDTPWLDKG